AARLFGSSVWNGAHGIAPRGLLDGHAHEATRTRRAGGATRSVVAGGTQRCSDRIAASPIAGTASAARPASTSQLPINCTANAAVVLSPITARPTTQLGAAQHTTQVMVVVAAPARSVPLAAAVSAPTRVER